MARGFSVVSFAQWKPGEPPDVSFVPPLSRRRLSLLQRGTFALCHALGRAAEQLPVFFASRDGEDALTRKQVELFNTTGEVSPGKFSSSVYNAAPGLWSISAGNVEPYTALAAGEETVEAGLLDALMFGGECVWVYAEETGGGYGCAAHFSPADSRSAGGLQAEFSGLGASGETLDYARVIDFFSGAGQILRGRYLTLSRRG